jgi:hypothetical protein
MVPFVGEGTVEGAVADALADAPVLPEQLEPAHLAHLQHLGLHHTTQKSAPSPKKKETTGRCTLALALLSRIFLFLFFVLELLLLLFSSKISFLVSF